VLVKGNSLTFFAHSSNAREFPEFDLAHKRKICQSYQF
jgi:hypothetical protein